MVIEPKPIASLEPGKRYVIKTARKFATDEDFERFREHLQRQAPECRFLILEKGFELAGVMGQCKDCKHFDPPLPDSRPDFGWCRRLYRRDGENTLAYAEDDTYSVQIQVSPEFGCIQFEAKEPQ